MENLRYLKKTVVRGVPNNSELVGAVVQEALHRREGHCENFDCQKANEGRGVGCQHNYTRQVRHQIYHPNRIYHHRLVT